MARRSLTHKQYMAIDGLLLALVVLIPLSEWVLPPAFHISEAMTTVFVFAVLGLGLNILTGFTGLLNLGVAAFTALGAYAFAISTCAIYPFQLGFWAGLLVTLVVGALAGFLLGAPTLRVRGDYLAIVTMGFGEIVKDTLINLDVVTKGTQGISDLPRPSLFGQPLGEFGEYYLILGILVVVVVGTRALEHSRMGRAWLSIREDDLASRAMGIRPDRTKMFAFATCAALASLAGGLMASRLSSSGEPANYDFQLSVMALCIIIVGGLGSVRGVLLGSLVMVGMNSIVLVKLAEIIGTPQPLAPGELEHSSGLKHALLFLRSWADNVLLKPSSWKFLLFGLALVLMMIFRPEGLLPPRGIHEEPPDGDDGPDKGGGRSLQSAGVSGGAA